MVDAANEKIASGTADQADEAISKAGKKGKEAAGAASAAAKKAGRAAKAAANDPQVSKNKRMLGKSRTQSKCRWRRGQEGRPRRPGALG